MTRKQRNILPYITALAGIILSLAVFVILQNIQRDKTHRRFDRIAHENFQFIKNNLDWHIGALTNIGSLFLASSHVDHGEFSLFTQPYLRAHESYQSLGWVMIIPDENYLLLERNLQNMQPDFYERLLKSNVSYPLYVLSHFKSHFSDHKSFEYVALEENTALDLALGNAKINKDVSFVIGNLNGIEKSKSNSQSFKDHLLIVNPVFTNHDRNNDIHGYSFSILDVGKLIEEALLKNKLKFMDMAVYHEVDTTSELIYGEYKNEEVYTYKNIITLGGQKLIFYFYPSAAFVKAYHSFNTYIIFASLLSFTVLAFLYLKLTGKNIAYLLKAREKAEELNRLKSDFLATMSHEIRTPMNGILGMAELIQGARPSMQIENYAKTIINSGESLQQIIDDILDFSKIEAGKLEIDLMPVNMVDLVDDAARLFAVKARDKAVELAVRYVPGTDQFVYADPVRIRQILDNLISNAIKFTDKGHVAITIEENEHANVLYNQVALKFSVMDTGIGLSEEAQDKIFEKFSQADNSTTRQYGGTGLGLSICKSLVQLMGGEISVKSKEGEGSNFWFTLPLTRNDKEQPIQYKTPILKDVRVLVVDDLPVIRELVKEQLRAGGMRCEDAVSGEDALIKMQKAEKEGDPYKIGIIDYLMPNMNGEMLVSALNNYSELRDICLVMLTAAGNPLADDSFTEKGFSAYIAKPVSAPALIESISIVWGKYQGGIKNQLIRLDTRSLGKNHGYMDEPVLPGRKILIAEDNLVNQVFVKEILEEMDVDYTIVSNGREAIDIVRDSDFQLIIMDCLMPEMDGYEATRIIRLMQKNGEVSQIPIVALTASAMKGDREKCLKAGMDDYLTKPVRKKELKDKVYTLITGKEFQGNIKMPIGSIQNIQAQEVESEQDNTDSVLDKDAVEKARQILKGKYNEMIKVYIDNSWERVEEITNAIHQNDIEAIIRPAHTLKSTSKQMGALTLSDMAKEMEYAAKSLQKADKTDNETIQAIELSLEDIKAMLSKTRRAFDKIAA